VSLLQSISRNIYSLNEKAMNKTKVRLDRLIHPTESLGKLEDICIKLAGIYENDNFDIQKKAIIAFGADHGVYEEGVAPDPQDITRLQFPNFVKGICGVGALSKFVGADVIAVDVGINSDEKLEGVLDCKIRKATSNMSKGPAMTREEAIRSLEIGIEMAESCIVKDYKIIGVGEMGIANTTPTTAIISVMSGCDPEEITDKGSGLKAERLKHKAQVIRNSIEINNPNPTDGIDVLHKVGGFEIGAMAGVILGCSANRIPVVLDGYISYAAALIAYRINPKVLEYTLASHLSSEVGAKKALELLKLSPFLDMNMRLGEGSGAALGFSIIDAAVYTYKNMATFDEIDMGR
jgi:nicotinate-nucleotide--dimethylbenzimidazole phosphoribosyltransferase